MLCYATILASIIMTSIMTTSIIIAASSMSTVYNIGIVTFSTAVAWPLLRDRLRNLVAIAVTFGRDGL